MVELVGFEWRIRAAGVDKGMSQRCGFLAGAPKGPGPGPCPVRDPASQAHSGAGSGAGVCSCRRRRPAKAPSGARGLANWLSSRISLRSHRAMESDWAQGDEAHLLMSRI